MVNDARQPRLGIFGGTFNPIHVGHLLIAEIARENLSLDQVLFIPAALSPLKTENESTTTPKQRLEMVQLAIGGNPCFRVDDREIKRGGTSYTIDTLRELRAEHAETELFFLMGADSLADFHLWRDPQEICKLAKVIVIHRGGHPAPDLELLKPHLQPNSLPPAEHLLKVPEMEISSSDLRQRISTHRSTRYQLHPAVEAYIAAEQLYRS